MPLQHQKHLRIIELAIAVLVILLIITVINEPTEPEPLNESTILSKFRSFVMQENLIDEDGDGYPPTRGDCNDNDPEISPASKNVPEYYNEDQSWKDYNCNNEQDLPVGTFFVTSKEYDPNLGGLSGADNKCQSEADNSNLAGNWKALLSTSKINAKDRISDEEYYNVRGELIDTEKIKLFNKSIKNAVRYNNDGAANESMVFTGTRFEGVPYSAFNCKAWTTNGTASVVYGHSGSADTNWIKHRTFQTCERPARLYCVRTP
tara:strand:+ start:101 stop:886 length:786 start_codon:yes stop_codon:yes gene_type:complete